MSKMSVAPGMSLPLLERVLARLGLADVPSRDLGGLRALYAAWCRHVPFDNIRKMTALRRTHRIPLPGMVADDFFTHWLAHGTGGTCWTSSNALYELFAAAGFPARRRLGAMRDAGITNHGTVTVLLEGQTWLVDSSMLTNEPLLLGRSVWKNDDPVWPTEVEPSGSTHVIWTHTPPMEDYLPCRLLDEATEAAACARYYENSRERSPFNQRLYARRNLPGELIVIAGATRFARTRHGTERRELSPEQLCEALQRDIGVSAECVEAWAKSGALTDSCAAPTGAAPPPITTKPPSLRV